MISANETVTKIQNEFGGAVLSALKGFANWIGLGDYVTERVVQGLGKEEIWDDLQSKLSEKLNKHQLNIDQLQAQLTKLESQGFDLTGQAAMAWAKAKRDMSDKISNAKKAQANAAVQAELAQTKIDRSRDRAREWNPNAVEESKDLISQAEKIIGEM